MAVVAVLSTYLLDPEITTAHKTVLFLSCSPNLHDKSTPIQSDATSSLSTNISLAVDNIIIQMRSSRLQLNADKTENIVVRVGTSAVTASTLPYLSRWCVRWTS